MQTCYLCNRTESLYSCDNEVKVQFIYSLQFFYEALQMYYFKFPVNEIVIVIKQSIMVLSVE